MTDQVVNRVWFTGDPIAVWAALDAFTDDKGNVDFRRVLPVPDGLCIKAGWDETWAAKGEPYHEPVDHEVVARLCENIRKHGHAIAEDWKIANWSTKWNAYHQRSEPRVIDIDAASVEADRRMADKDATAEAFAIAVRQGRPLDVVLVFTTAWNAPKPVLVELSKAHPDVTVHLEYADEAVYEHGYEAWCAGNSVRSWVPVGEEAVRFAYRVSGHSPFDEGLDYWDETIDRAGLAARGTDESVRERYCEAFYAAYEHDLERAHRAGAEAVLGAT